MNGYVGVGALAAIAGSGGDAGDVARALTAIRVGLELLDGCGTDEVSERDLRRLLQALTDATDRLIGRSARPRASVV